MMRKYAFTALAVLAGALLLFPRGDNAPLPEALSPQTELSMKEATMNQDVARTDELCRLQCSYELRRVGSAIGSDPGSSAPKLLARLQQDHPHMEWLVRSERSKPLSQSDTVGSLSESIRSQTQAAIDQAKKRLDAGEAYQSEQLDIDGRRYFVLGEPSADNGGNGNGSGNGIIAVVQQHILHQVADHQRKNLRLVPYPAEGRYKIESVDSKTLKDVHVDHPEDNQGTSHYHQNQVVVRFNQEPTEASLAQISGEIGGSLVRKLGYTYVFESDKLEAQALVHYFRKWNVAYAEPHFLYLTNSRSAPMAAQPDPSDAREQVFRPNDALYRRYQWNLPQIETEAGWDITKGSEQVIVAVVDTGADLTHPDLKDQLVSGINVVNQEGDPQDDVGHGTHVAGVIGALVNNNLGVAGMSWYNRIMPVKVLDATGAGSTYAVAQGIIWAVDHGAKVINMSLGNYADAQFLHDAIKYAYDRDVVMIAASGNDNTETPGFPAAYPEVFAVAAVDSNKSKASFSNYGDYIDVAAPGVSIASTYPHNQYAALSGTSMASPHVTALAALIRSANPELKNTEVMQLMRDTATDLGPKGKDKYYGYGLIDVARALQAARPQAAGQQQNHSAVDNTNLGSSWSDWLRTLFGS
ncbi:Subtilase family protein [Paenibacillus sp. UNCCL117]|uniref:S8 family peptidase n=1 Tax=unclassified Paenibacillus TaxID=185978 RepID=UPI00087F75E4|nr:MULTISPECIES: S8 family peptidase [unclassified Paenibacillus]SDC72858.1 Subtilase family protein [Paenibacillus sp. cl123]SFW24881.1 Subtilase family protein [Paenibacillus sp. UNCCL117]